MFRGGCNTTTATLSRIVGDKGCSLCDSCRGVRAAGKRTGYRDLFRDGCICSTGGTANVVDGVV